MLTATPHDHLRIGSELGGDTIEGASRSSREYASLPAATGVVRRRTVSNAASIPNPRRLTPRQLEHRKRRVALVQMHRRSLDPPIAASARTPPTPSRTDT